MGTRHAMRVFSMLALVVGVLALAPQPATAAANVTATSLPERRTVRISAA
jgi:hypothetical protein